MTGPLTGLCSIYGLGRSCLSPKPLALATTKDVTPEQKAGRARTQRALCSSYAANSGGQHFASWKPRERSIFSEELQLIGNL